jgi:hypothetical protein
LGYSEPSKGKYVPATAARQKSRINHGHLIRDLLFFKIATANATGTIHSALASLIVVPIINAWEPYFAVAPTTELVSWMARADHNPN